MRKFKQYLIAIFCVQSIGISADITNRLGASYYEYGGNYEYSYYNLSWYYAIVGDINKGFFQLPDTEFSIYLSTSKSTYKGDMWSNDANLVLKTDLFANQKFSPFLIFQWTFDSTTALDYRYNPGIGGKVRLGPPGFSISYAFLGEYYKYTGYDEDQLLRHSIRPKLKLYPVEGIEIVEQLYYKPENGNSENYLIENILTIYVDTVIPGTAITFEHTYNVNSNPPLGYAEEDTFFSVGISVEL